MTSFKTAIAIAVGTLFAGAAFAQSNYSIEQRDRAEQERINRGVQSGQLTQREADRLQSQRAQIERLESRARSDGRLTQNERARIDNAQDRLSRDIYRESHDRQTAGSGGRGGDHRNAWGGRNERSDHGRWGQHDQRGAPRNDRNDSHGSNSHGNSPQASNTQGNNGRWNQAPGRQPHLQQSDGQRTHVQQAQARTARTEHGRPPGDGGQGARR